VTTFGFVACLIVQHGAQQLRNAPGLRDAAAGPLRRVAIEDFGNLAQTFLRSVPA
jgi:hypothetical protein